jgi:hypothetical protein
MENSFSIILLKVSLDRREGLSISLALGEILLIKGNCCIDYRMLLEIIIYLFISLSLRDILVRRGS